MIKHQAVFDAVYYRVWKPIHMTEWDDLISQNAY